ncbi:MAG: class I SAM-dependent methyltransferase [Caulobacteraceae bacterium]
MTQAAESPVSARVAMPSAFRTVANVLARNWIFGSLTLRTPGGETLRFQGQKPGPDAVLHLIDWRAARRMVSGGSLGFAEGFMAGEWDTPDLSALLQGFAVNLDRIVAVIRGKPLFRWTMSLLHRFNANTREGSRRNIHAHYDLGNDFYALWLDPSMTYSSARYGKGARTLEAAQAAKYASLERLIELKPGEHVLEIGCGWGGFAEHAAKHAGAEVTGITISKAQLDFARERMTRQRLDSQVALKFEDYRDLHGQFDRIASIEMFEAVGEEYWNAYFAKVKALLKPGGLAGLQIISIREDIFETYRKRADFIQRYIFPGGMLPSETRLRAEIARAGLVVRKVELFGADYARTLREWRDRFEAVKDQVSAQGFDERFQRMWRYYLAYCEAGFATGRTNVGQWVVGHG